MSKLKILVIIILALIMWLFRLPSRERGELELIPIENEIPNPVERNVRQTIKPEPTSEEPVELGRKEIGIASWYGEYHRGHTTACGQVFNPDEFTCASRTLWCGTRLLVGHEGRSVVVVVTDYGPAIPERILDLSQASFAELADLDRGLIKISIEEIK